MSFGGHVQEMINSIKQNEALKKAHREQYQRIKDAQFIGKENKEHHSIRKKEISEEELEKVKEKIREERNSEKKKELIRNVAIIVILIIAGILLLNWIR
jgi:ABC-type multidrug transport system fused ATPase/permease subunit